MNLKYTLFKLLEMVFLSYTFPVTFSICTDFIGWIKMSSTSFSRIVFTGCFYKQVSLEGRDSPMLAVDLNSKVIKVLSLTLERWLGFFSSNDMGFKSQCFVAQPITKVRNTCVSSPCLVGIWFQKTRTSCYFGSCGSHK